MPGDNKWEERQTIVDPGWYNHLHKSWHFNGGNNNIFCTIWRLLVDPPVRGFQQTVFARPRGIKLTITRTFIWWKLCHSPPLDRWRGEDICSPASVAVLTVSRTFVARKRFNFQHFNWEIVLEGQFHHSAGVLLNRLHSPGNNAKRRMSNPLRMSESSIKIIPVTSMNVL